MSHRAANSHMIDGDENADHHAVGETPRCTRTNSQGKKAEGHDGYQCHVVGRSAGHLLFLAQPGFKNQELNQCLVPRVPFQAWGSCTGLRCLYS